MVLVSLAELGAARYQRGRQGRLECQGSQGTGGNRSPGLPLTSSTLCNPGVLTGGLSAGTRAVVAGCFSQADQRRPEALGCFAQCHAGFRGQVEIHLRQHLLHSIPTHLPIGRDRGAHPHALQSRTPTAQLLAQRLELLLICELA